MAVSFKEKLIAKWNQDISERLAEPLYPEAIQSVFFVIPNNSGDVALATTVVRYIKARNPRCKVSFAVKRANFPLLEMCPGIDEKFEWILFSPSATLSRRQNLAEYEGRADVVIYPICACEDLDLLWRYNFLETIWLLSGVPNGLPEEAQKLWLNPPDDAQIACRVLNRCLSREFAAELTMAAHRQSRTMLYRMRAERTLRNVGWKTVPVNSWRLLRQASFVTKLSGRADISHPGRKFVIVSSEANSLPPPAKGLFEVIIRFFRSQGRVVLHNVRDPLRAAPGTVPLVCSYPEFLCLREAGVPFVGWRSGLCDIAAASSTPMCVIYPRSLAGCVVKMAANIEVPLTTFGFESMNVATNCIEMACDSVNDLDMAKLATLLD